MADALNKEHLTAEQVAALLQQSTATIQRWRKNGKLPGFFRIGRQWLIKRADLDNFINQKLLNN